MVQRDGSALLWMRQSCGHTKNEIILDDLRTMNILTAIRSTTKVDFVVDNRPNGTTIEQSEPGTCISDYQTNVRGSIMQYFWIMPNGGQSAPTVSELFTHKLSVVRAAEQFIRDKNIAGEWDGDTFVGEYCIYIYNRMLTGE